MKRSNPPRFLPLAVLALAIPACDDPTEIGDHNDAEGIAISVDGAEIYRYMLDDGTPQGLALDPGIHQTSIVLLDHDGDPMPQGDEELDEDIRVTSNDADVLTWAQAAEGGNPTVMDVTGTLRAFDTGSTTLEICVLHEGHCDFEAVIPVAVTGAT